MEQEARGNFTANRRDRRSFDSIAAATCAPRRENQEALIPVGDVIEVVLRGHYNGHPVGNRLHFELQDVLATETTLFNALDAGGGVLQEYCASMSLVWQLPAVTTRKVLPELGVLTSWTPTHNGGTINARVGAMQDAIVLSLRTGLGGRARRGRMYLMTMRTSPIRSWHYMGLVGQGPVFTGGLFSPNDTSSAP